MDSIFLKAIEDRLEETIFLPFNLWTRTSSIFNMSLGTLIVISFIIFIFI
ncbi:MPPV-165 variola B22R-like protein [Magpiepox virus 2]|nr:MPPV-165 variola B22R-like protein [Magpiepox virus 2]